MRWGGKQNRDEMVGERKHKIEVRFIDKCEFHGFQFKLIHS